MEGGRDGGVTKWDGGGVTGWGGGRGGETGWGVEGRWDGSVTGCG